MRRSCGMRSPSSLVAAVASLLLLLEAPSSLATDGQDQRTSELCNADELTHYLLGGSDTGAGRQPWEQLYMLQNDDCNSYGPLKKECLLGGSRARGQGGLHQFSQVPYGSPFEEDEGYKLHRLWSDPTKSVSGTSSHLAQQNQIMNCLAMLSKQLHCTSDEACNTIEGLLSSAQRNGACDGSLVASIQESAFFNVSAGGRGYLKGFYFDATSRIWLDIDECRENTSGCAHECENTIGSFRCKCRAGYEIQADQRSCQDVDECRLNMTECDQECENTDGSFRCRCQPGYRLMSDGTTCIDIDECRRNETICSHKCENTIGSYKCKCRRGYFLMDDKRSCDNRDECALDKHGRMYAPCSHICTNMANGFMCSCPKGFVINRRNPAECIDVRKVVAPTPGVRHKSHRQ